MKKVELIPIFKDNYVFLIIDTDHNEAIIVDPGESETVTQALKQKNLNPAAILATHHHSDHIGGIDILKNNFQIPVYAPAKNQNQIKADYYINDTDTIKIASFDFKVIALPGHTLGHCAYWFEKEKWLFSGDVLFGLGCGRLFEGTYEEAFVSLQKIKSLPDDTLIFCTHEYTETNLRFCKSLPINDNPSLKEYEIDLLKKRKSGLASVPLILVKEKQVNPFLISKNVNDFKMLRETRNSFL